MMKVVFCGREFQVDTTEGSVVLNPETLKGRLNGRVFIAPKTQIKYLIVGSKEYIPARDGVKGRDIVVKTVSPTLIGGFVQGRIPFSMIEAECEEILDIPGEATH